MKNVCKVFSKKDYTVKISKLCLESSKLGLLKGPQYFREQLEKLKEQAELTADPKQQVDLLKESIDTFYEATETPLGRYVRTILQPVVKDQIFSKHLKPVLAQDRPVSSTFEEIGKASNRARQRNLLDNQFKNAPNAKLYFQRTTKVDMVETFLVKRSGDNPTFYESQEAMNKSVMEYKQHLLDTIFKYFESINTENLDSYSKNIYENNKYTGILESKELKSLFENLSPKIFQQIGMKPLDKFYANYRDSNDQNDKLFLDAYNACFILQNFDTIVQDTIGSIVKIKDDKNGHKVNYHKYEIKTMATNIWRNWTSSDDIADMAEVISDVTQYLIETSRMYERGSNEAYPDRYVSFNDFNYIVGKIKNLVHAKESKSINLSKIVQTYPASFETIQILEEIEADNIRNGYDTSVSLKQLLARLNEDPQKYLHSVFDLLCNTYKFQTNDIVDIDDALQNTSVLSFFESTDYKLNDFELNLLWSFNKEIFGGREADTRSLYRLHNNSEQDNVYPIITQVAASTFPEEYLQYYERNDGTIGSRLLRDYAVDRIQNTLDQTLQKKASTLTQKMRKDYNIIYTSRDNGNYLAQATLTIKDEQNRELLTITGTSDNVMIDFDATKAKDIWKNSQVQSLFKDMLGINFEIDPDLSNAYILQTGGFIKALQELGRLVGRATFNSLVNKEFVIAKHKISNRADLKSFIEKQFQDSAADYLKTTRTNVPLLSESDKNNLYNLAMATAMNNSVLSAAQSKTGEGTSLANFVLSRMRNFFPNQVEIQCKKAESAVRDLDFVTNDNGLFKGILSKREIKTLKTNQQTTKFSDQQAIKLGFLTDFVSSFIPNPDKNQYIKNGISAQLPTVNSDKPQIDGLLTDLNAKIEIPKGSQQFKKVIELSNAELEQVMGDQFGKMYNTILHNINADLIKVVSLIKHLIPSGFVIRNNSEILQNHDLLQVLNKIFENDASLGKPKDRVINGLHKLLTEYNKNHFRNPIQLAANVHYMIDGNGLLTSNSTLEALWGRFNSHLNLDAATRSHLESLYSGEGQYHDFMRRNNLQDSLQAHSYFQYKDYLTTKHLIETGFKIALYGPDSKSRQTQQEIQFLKGKAFFTEKQLYDPNYRYLYELSQDLGKNWVSEKDGTMIIAKGYINGTLSEIRTVSQLKQATNIQLHPMLSKLNRIDYLTTQQYIASTVGSHYAHSVKKPSTTQVLTEESARQSAANKRNVAATSTVHLYQRNVLNGAPSIINLATISDTTFDLYSVMGDMYRAGHKPLDGCMFSSAWLPDLLNNSLAGERAGNIQKPFGTFYDERLGAGGIVKTASFPSTNHLMRNYESWRNLQRAMSSKKWIAEKSGPNGENIYEVISITQDYLGRDINYEDVIKGPIMYKRPANDDPSILAAYRLDKIESLGNNQYIIWESEIDKYGNPITESKPRTELVQGNVYDDFGNLVETREVEEYKVITIDNNWDLFTQVFGGYNSLEIGEDGELTWSENSNKLMVHAINNVGKRKNFDHIKDRKLKHYLQNKTKGLDQTDIWQPLKYSDVHLIPNEGAIKSLAYNMNPDGKAVLEGKAELNHFTMRLAQFGIQLDKEHHADAAEVSLPTQIMQAAANKGYTLEYTQEIYKALSTLTRQEIKPFLNAIKDIIVNGSDAPNSQAALVESVTNLIIENLITKKDEDSPVNAILKDLFDKAEAGQEIKFADDIKGKIAWSDPTIMNKLFATLSTTLSNAAVKVKSSGVLSIICPTDTVISLQGDRLLGSFEKITNDDGSTRTLNQKTSLEVYQDNVRNGKEVDSNGRNMLIFDLSRDAVVIPERKFGEDFESYEARVNKIHKLNTLSKLSELKTQHNYIVEYEDGSTEQITINTPTEYYKIKESVINGKQRDTSLLETPLTFQDFINEAVKEFPSDVAAMNPWVAACSIISEGKISRASLKEETGWGKTELNKFLRLYKSKNKGGGRSIENVGERVWRAYPQLFADSMEATNMVLNILTSVQSLSEIYNAAASQYGSLVQNQAVYMYNQYENHILEKYGKTASEYYDYYYSTIPVTKVYEDVQTKRSLAAYNVRFSNKLNVEGILNQRFQIYDLDSVQLLFELNNIVPTKPPKGYEKFMDLSLDKQQEILNRIFKSVIFQNTTSILPILQKQFKNLPKFDENFIVNFTEKYPNELGNFISLLYNNLKPRVYKKMQQDLFKLSENYSGENRSIYINGELIEPMDIEHDAYELIMPKIYKTQFGLNEYDDLQEILRDKDFFIKRGLQRFKCRFSNHNLYDYELKRFNGDHVYVLDKSKGIPPELQDSVINIEHIMKRGRPFRVDDDQQVIYEMSSSDDFVCKMGGVEIIVTNNPLFYVQNLNYNTLKTSPTRVTEESYQSLIDTLKVSKRTNSKNFLKAISISEDAYFDLKTFKQFNEKIDAINYDNVKSDHSVRPDFKSVAQLCNILLQNGRELHTSFDESLNLIAGRIPAQSQQSFMPQRVMAFDDVDRNTAMVSTFQLFLQGSDLDIDAVTLLGYEFNKNGKFIGWSPHFNIENKQNLQASKNIPLPTGEQKEIIASERNATNNFFEVYDKYFGTLFTTIQIGATAKNVKTKDGVPELQIVATTPEQINLLAEFLRDFNKYGIQIKADLKENNKLRAKSEFFEREKIVLENGTEVQPKWNLFREDVLNIGHDQTYAIAQQLLDFANEHNNYINIVDEFVADGMSKNYMVHYVYKVSSSASNQTECQESVDNSTYKGKQEAGKYESNDFAPGGFETKHMQIGEGQAGKEGVGIGATAIKANSTTQYYLDKILNEGSNKDLSKIRFRENGHIINGKQYLCLSNIYTSKSEDPTRSNFASALALLNSLEREDQVTENVATNLGSMLSLAVDNAKDLALKKINSGPRSMGLYAYGLSLGMPLEELAQIINSPQGRLLVKMTEGCMFNNDITSFKLLDVFDKLNGYIGGEINQYTQYVRTKEGNLISIQPNVLVPVRVPYGGIERQQKYVTNTTEALYTALFAAYDEWINEDSINVDPATNLSGMVQHLIEYRKFSDILAKVDVSILRNYIQQVRNQTNNDQETVKNIKATLNQLVSYIQDIEAKSIMFYNSPYASDLRVLAEGAEEMRILGSILSINKGLKATVSETEAFIDTIENLIYNRKLAMGQRPSEEDKIDFEKFMLSKSYQQQVIDNYEKVKHSVNIPHLLSMVEHFQGYLQAEIIPITFFTTSSVKYRTLTKYRKNVNADTKEKPESLFSLFGVESKRDKESILRGLENLIQFKLFTRWAYDKKLTFKIPKGFEYFSRKSMTSTNANYRATTSNDQMELTIPLYTEAGLATFKKYMEEYYIPTLQSDASLMGNTFIKNLTPHRFDKTPTHLEVDVYTLAGDLMAKKGRQAELNQKMFADFQNLAGQALNGLSVHDAFYLYSQYCYMGRKGQTSLMALFDNEDSRSTLCQSFNKHIANMDVEGNISCSRDELIAWCAPIGAQSSSANYAYVIGKYELERSLKQRVKEQIYLSERDEELMQANEEAMYDTGEDTYVSKPENFVTYKDEYLSSHYDQVVKDHFLVPSVAQKVEKVITAPLTIYGLENTTFNVSIKSDRIVGIELPTELKKIVESKINSNVEYKYSSVDEFESSLMQDLDGLIIPYKVTLFKSNPQQVDFGILQTIIKQKIDC